MKFLSVCSGIEAASVASAPLGWRAAGFSEIEPFPSAVLAHHYPEVPNWGDMRKIPERIESGEIEAPDLLCGGTPCQAFSVAGKRQSLQDARGNLSLTFCDIADAIDLVRAKNGQPLSVIFWENVPGVLSTPDNAFGCFLAQLSGEDRPLLPPGGRRWADAGLVLGPSRAIAWRVLDAQHFGLAQRRRRVFVVASAGTVDPCQVLFESEGVRRDTPPSREAGQGNSHDLAPCLGASGRGVERAGETRGQDPVVACMAHGQANAETRTDGGAPTLTCNHEAPIVAHSPTCFKVRCGCEGGGKGYLGQEEAAFTLATGANQHPFHQMAVRRLTPTECERLQGFPDGYTAIPYKGKPASECPDGPRYKALGNSWAVPVVRWIFRRIDAQGSTDTF